MRVSRDASCEGCSFSAPSVASTNLSTGVRTQVSFVTAGAGDLRGATYAQCSTTAGAAAVVPAATGHSAP